MTDVTLRQRLVDLSVVLLSTLAFGAGLLVVADVDHDREAAPAAVTTEAPASARPRVVTHVASPPVRGLSLAPRPARRVIMVRRTRAS